MNIASHCPPIDPIRFRDDVCDLLTAAEEFEGEPGFDFCAFAGIHFVSKYVRSRDDFDHTNPPPVDDPDRVYSTSAFMRLTSLMNVLRTPGKLKELARRDAEGVHVHVALFEASAAVPFAEGKEFARSIRTEGRKRKIEIDVLDRLLPEDLE